mmetsp:Transcript_139334/g.445541  ORF Transcript_139334/g.445541 Transcript_139334/m.445541 type:complete len:204 (-) Transcript_139334:411-1022(-)
MTKRHTSSFDIDLLGGKLLPIVTVTNQSYINRTWCWIIAHGVASIKSWGIAPVLCQSWTRSRPVLQQHVDIKQGRHFANRAAIIAPSNPLIALLTFVHVSKVLLVILIVGSPDFPHNADVTVTSDRSALYKNIGTNQGSHVCIVAGIAFWTNLEVNLPTSTLTLIGRVIAKSAVLLNPNHRSNIWIKQKRHVVTDTGIAAVRD